METTTRNPIEADVDGTLVAAARRFMALHPDVEAVAVTLVSRVLDPREICTVIVGRDGPVVTPNAWALIVDRILDGATYCIQQIQGLMVGLAELANEMSRTVEGLRHEQRLQAPTQDTAEAQGGHRRDG